MCEVEFLGGVCRYKVATPLIVGRCEPAAVSIPLKHKRNQNTIEKSPGVVAGDSGAHSGGYADRGMVYSPLVVRFRFSELSPLPYIVYITTRGLFCQCFYAI